jgi:hypothetical protein
VVVIGLSIPAEIWSAGGGLGAATDVGCSVRVRLIEDSW